MSIRDVELHIEKQVLHGFEPRHSGRVARASERELVRLRVEYGVPQSLTNSTDLYHVDGGTIEGEGFEVVRGTKPEMIGGQVAWVVYGGFQR